MLWTESFFIYSERKTKVSWAILVVLCMVRMEWERAWYLFVWRAVETDHREEGRKAYFEIYTYGCSGRLVVELVVAVPYQH